MYAHAQKRYRQYYTSAKMNEYGCRDAPCEKSWKQGNPLSNTIKDISTIMRNPLSKLCREGLCMIVLVSLIVLLRGFPCFHDFSHGCIPTSIFVNDFCTCSTYFSWFAYKCSYTHAYMRSAHAAPLSRA